jgi:glycosyltransferase involved in cell wall biosynthesis
MPPVISVIIPAYNRSSTIARSVQSVLVQTFQDFEIIVIDDGSTDTTREVVQKIADKRIHLICHHGNQGAAVARNTGMQAATGEYIAWLDSDDEWLPEKLDIQLQALNLSASNARACYTAYELFDGGQSRLYIPEHTDYKKLFLRCDQAPGSSLLFERSILQEIGYLDTSLRRYEDWDWLLRYCSKYCLVAIDQPLTRVYFTPDRSSAHIESSAVAFVEKYSQVLRQFGFYRNIVISRRWIEVASYYAREHKFMKMVYFLARGFFMFPFHHPGVWAWVINGWLGIKIGLSLKKNG